MLCDESVSSHVFTILEKRTLLPLRPAGKIATLRNAVNLTSKSEHCALTGSVMLRMLYNMSGFHFTRHS